MAVWQAFTLLTSSKGAHETADEMIWSDTDGTKTTAKVKSLNYVAHVLRTQHTIQSRKAQVRLYLLLN